jgi:adenosylmethionine-8-amino-7-oxononanoate aminotransferase
VVAEANLDILAEEELVARAAAAEDVLTKVLDPLRDHPLVTEVRSGAGFLAGVALRADVDGAAVAADVTDDGVILRAIHENTLQICPPFVVTDDEVDHIATTIRTALDRRVT